MAFIHSTARFSANGSLETTPWISQQLYRKARLELMACLAEDDVDLEVLQTLCLLIQAEIAGNELVY